MYIRHVYKQELKKSLGQHFLTDENVLQKIAAAIGDFSAFKTVVEVGPGMGALTKYLVKQNFEHYYVVELDDRWAAYLKQNFVSLRDKVINEDFLTTDLAFMQNPTHVVGNFPYNISSQIVFRIIDERERVQQMTGMFQKEVAQRIVAKQGSKDYGVLSVLTQAYYSGEYLFDVPPGCFNPPPKVMSGVIRLVRKNEPLGCDEVLFKRVVKAAFNQRRKTMRNSLRDMVNNNKVLLENPIFNLRPEQLSVQELVGLTNLICL